MVEHATRVYPPLGDETRYEAILTRGRVLRRRRRAGVGVAGAGGAMAAAALVVVLFAATGPSGGDPVVADQDETGITTTTTAPVVSSTETTATIVGEALPVQVVVSDPVQPVATLDDTPAQQCVLATLTDRSGAPVAEGFACRSAVQSTQAVVEVPLTVIPPGGAAVGCSVSATRADPTPRSTASAESTFRVPTPEGLAAGTYTIRIDAVSGIGDGCGGSTDGSTEDEHQADPITAEVTVP